MNWEKNLLFASAGAFIAAVGFSMVIPFLPMYLDQMGVKDNLSVWTGIMLSSTSLAYGVMAPVWGSLADRHGKRIMLIRSGIGIAVTYALMGVVQNHYQFLALRIANGLLSGFIPAAIMLVATNTPDKHLGFALGIIQTAVAVGNILGPLVGGISARTMGLSYSFFFAAGMITMATILAVAGTKEHIAPVKEKRSILSDIREVMAYPMLRALFIAQIVIQSSLYAIQPTLPLYIARLTSRNVELITGVIFSVVGISTAIGAPAVGRLPGANYERVFYHGLLIAAVLSLTQGMTGNIYILGLERFIMGFAIAAITVSNNVLIARSVAEEMRGRAFGVLNSFLAIGFVAGPIIGGFLGEHLGLASSFYGSGLLFLVAVMVFKVLPHQGKIKMLSSRFRRRL